VHRLVSQNALNVVRVHGQMPLVPLVPLCAILAALVPTPQPRVLLRLLHA